VVDRIAILRLPDQSKARGYRESLSTRARFAVDDLGAGLVAVAPTEGAGVDAEFFKLQKICDANSDLEDPATWQPIRDNPPLQRDNIDRDTYPQQMIDRALEIRDTSRSVEAEIVGLALNAMGAAEVGELDQVLALNVPPLLERFPKGSLWLVTVDDLLLARLAFGRTQLALALTPDMPFGPDMERLSAFEDLTLTKGINFEGIMSLPLVALSPAALGLLIPAMPHVLVFCFGTGIDLRKPYPVSFASLYRPSVLNDPEGLDRSRFAGEENPEDGPLLLSWWVARLNTLYSHITDPTRFTDGDGYYDAAAQTAWLITCERLIGDAVSLLAEPQATDLDRTQMAFDLLDKAEGLLGYDKNNSGAGFQALLRRATCVPRLRSAYEASLPRPLAKRLGDEVQRLFDGLYDEIRANSLSYRLTKKGARFATGSATGVAATDNDTYVSKLCRAVRNSSHGVLEVLRNHDDRFLLATNTGGIPAELPALAPLIALGLLADPLALFDGSWRTKLVNKSKA
jgi:hypothetical protein